MSADGVGRPVALGRRAVLLDALGTLVALEPPAPALAEELAARFGVRVGLAEAERAIAAEIAYYRAHLDDGRDEASLAGLRARCAEVLGAELGPAIGPAIDREQLTEVLLASLRFRAYDDAAPALARLRNAGLRLVVVSNWDVSLRSVLERLGIASLLDGVITSAEVGARKPAPEVFRAALELAGVAARDALHVGDSLVEDIDGARAAGIEAVLLLRDGSDSRAVEAAATPVRTITSLAELEM